MKAKKSKGRLVLSLLNDVVNIEVGRPTLILGESYTGKTAICLELVKDGVAGGFPTVYFDIKDSLVRNRLIDIDLKNFVISKPTSVTELLKQVQSIKNSGVSPIYILDNVDLIPDSFTIEKIAERILLLDTECIVICAPQSQKYNTNFWTEIVSLEVVNTRREDEFPIGHLLLVRGTLGEKRVYIEYNHGLISRGYIKALEQLDKVGKSGTFRDGDIVKQGFWKFIDEVDKR